MKRTIRVCQNTTCRKQGAAKVLAAFEKLAPNEVKVEASGCLGHCGSGPNVLILPENEWCFHVQPKDVPGIVREYCEMGLDTDEDLTRKHELPMTTQSEANQMFRLWLIVIGGIVGMIALISWLVSKNSYYV